MKQLTTALLLTLSLFAAAPGAVAAPLLLAQNGNAVTIDDLTGKNLSLDQAVRQVRRETGGRILSARTVEKGGVTLHRIKVLTPDNRVIIYEIDR
ncbi:MAG: hypothetical protein OQL05_11405 [Gammaproteobacteria bacterium]|nr:hypothetical protein [Gammaproteobacteria bacterium]MCW8992026.1 hypothetical protein [Gammaproteobacteria bacterium]MCW9089575.1 hypothetical protein [Gammaproteobacteria bacterium]